MGATHQPRCADPCVGLASLRLDWVWYSMGQSMARSADQRMLNFSKLVRCTRAWLDRQTSACLSGRKRFDHSGPKVCSLSIQLRLSVLSCVPASTLQVYAMRLI